MGKLFKMLALIQNENMKIYSRVRTWVMTGLILFLLLFVAILLTLISSTVEAVYDMISFMNFATSFISLATIFTVVIASDSVSSEFTWGTIKLLLTRPTKRWKILLSKYITSLLFAGFLLLFIFLTSMIIGFFFFGLSDLSEITLGDILAKYGYQIISLIVIVTFSFMLSTLFRSSILAIVLSLLILFFGNTITGIFILFEFEWAKYLLFTNLDLSIYAKDGVGPYFPGMSLGFSITVLFVYFVIFHVIAFWLFNKRDVAF